MSEIRMRQICLVAHDLDRIQQQCESVFGVEVCYRDPGVGKYGLHNFLIPFGDQFLETVSPQPGEHDTPGGRYLKRRGGDGGYMVIMQVPRDSYAGYQQRVSDLGIRLVSEPGRSERGMGMQLHPKDVPGPSPNCAGTPTRSARMATGGLLEWTGSGRSTRRSSTAFAQPRSRPPIRRRWPPAGARSWTSRSAAATFL